MSNPLTPNQAAMANLEKRMKNISACRQKQEEALLDPAYKKNQGVVRKLSKDSDDRLKALRREKEIRQELAHAEAWPESPIKLAAARRKLAEHCKKYPNYYAKQKIKDPCFRCGSGLKGLRDPTYPTWCKYSKRNPYGGGWVFAGSPNLSIAKFQGWEELIKSGQKTASERNVINSVASNEGRFDSVQGYDSEAVSVGVMQKTVNSKNGEGELPIQISRFKEYYPDRYEELFAKNGWTVRRDTISTKVIEGHVIDTYSRTRLYYKDPTNSKMEPITGAKLKEYLCQKNPEVVKRAMTPLRMAGNHPDFQKQQVMDYNSRLLETLQNKTPKRYKFKIARYISSERGAALILDQSVNAPGKVSRDLGKALDELYKHNPDASMDPSEWPDSTRLQYENQIIDYYKSHRFMTDSDLRCQRIMSDTFLSEAVKTMEIPE